VVFDCPVPMIAAVAGDCANPDLARPPGAAPLRRRYDRSMPKFLTLAFALALAACASQPTPGKIDYQCTTDNDCAVKNVGNCCGEYPTCVNRESPTFPDLVKAECEKKGAMSVCGFPTPTGCSCVAGRCTDVH